MLFNVLTSLFAFAKKFSCSIGAPVVSLFGNPEGGKLVGIQNAVIYLHGAEKTFKRMLGKQITMLPYGQQIRF